MKSQLYKKFDGWPASVLGLVVLGAIAAYGVYTFNNLEIEKSKILTELESERAENYQLLQAVREREDIINTFQYQISQLGGTVGVLQKLSQTDEELLKKYSKVYFLNENYVPAKLTEIDKAYVNNGSTNSQVNTDVWPHLKNLLDAAQSDGVELKVASAYRSFQTQSSLKSAYAVTYGAGANRFSADQGYSEHQLGTAVDFTTSKLGAAFSAFGSDPAYKWLKENAHNYGFTLSYPENNKFYKYEPWHWRYVGVELATRLHEGGKFFYDLDQREIDEYLIKLFD